MAAENAPARCAHCEVILAELERCKPLVPEPTRWGGSPFWGRGSMVAPHQTDHPALGAGGLWVPLSPALADADRDPGGVVNGSRGTGRDFIPAVVMLMWAWLR